MTSSRNPLSYAYRGLKSIERRLLEHRRRSKLTISQLKYAGKTLECIEQNGVVVPIDPELCSEPILESIRSGVYEEHEASELKTLIQPGEVILELGAGVGFISTYCAKHDNTQEVHCVEANPNLIELIKVTHKINNVDVTLYHEILSKEEGETDFYLHDDFWASGTHSWLGKKIRVKTMPFQARLDQIKPTMLIIDIEGGEETIFEDINLNGVQRIMLEMHQPTIGRHGMKKVFDLLSAQNFHYDTWHSHQSIVTFSHVDAEETHPWDA